MRDPRYRLFSWLSAPIILTALFSTPLFPQSLEQKVKDLEKRIAQLEQKIVKLESMIVQAQKGQAKPAAVAPDRWKAKANWRLLKKGMNKSDVERILGEPPTVVANVHYGDIWYYPDSKGGNASFDKDGILTSWNEI